MTYSHEQIEQIDLEYLQVTNDLRDLAGRVVCEHLPTLTQPRAKEYLTHGLCRRISIITRCVEQVFRIYPPDRTALLDRDERIDIEIGLHAFVINIHGALDNLAWSLVFEKLPTPPDRRKVGLFSETLRKLLPLAADAYLHDAKILSWYKNYSAIYRDTLAHRIPLYVPPTQLLPEEQRQYEELQKEIGTAAHNRDFARMNELLESQRKLGSIFPVFVHSFYDPDATPPVLIHTQLIVDGKTLIEIVKRVVGLQ